MSIEIKNDSELNALNDNDNDFALILLKGLGHDLRSKIFIFIFYV